MAELDIGQNCSKPDCHQLDFLPFPCDRCKLVFCREHRQPFDHDCTAIQDSSQAVCDHSATASFPCSVADCTNREFVQIVCRGCSDVFCLSHRSPLDHNCPSVSAPHANQAKSLSSSGSKMRESDTKKARTGAKSAQTSAKVALMKLKQYAVGDKAVPQTERVYLRILPPQTSKLSPTGFFFSKRWAVGKVVDYSASHLKLKNDPCLHEKLRLFSVATGQEFLMSAKLESLADHLISGQDVILEYSNTGQLASTDSYK